MTILYLCCVLISITYVLAATAGTFRYKDEMINVLQSLGFDANSILTNASEQCLTSIENTYECFQSVNQLLVAGNLNAQNFEGICSIYNSQTCEYFRTTVVNGNSGCVNDFDHMYFSLNFDLSIFYYVGACTKNQENEYCPAVNHYRSILSKDISKTTDADKEQIAKASTSDPSCLDQMKKILALTPSIFKMFDLTFPLSGETEVSLNQIKVALDTKPMEETILNESSSYATKTKLSIAITILIIISSLFIIF